MPGNICDSTSGEPSTYKSAAYENEESRDTSDEAKQSGLLFFAPDPEYCIIWSDSVVAVSMGHTN